MMGSIQLRLCLVTAALCCLHDPAMAGSKAAGVTGNPAQFFGPEQYPPEALRAHQQGRVVARLWVDTEGKVASCSVRQSSGSRSLDATTCEIALSRVTYSPATDKRGRPIASEVMLPVRWVLPEGPTEVGDMPREWKVEQTISVDSAGEVVACASISTPPNPAATDPCSEWPVGQKLPNPWLLNGKPVGGVMKREMHGTITFDQQ
jgi:TonB family protein